MVKVIGVDFSGAKESGSRSNTWITEASLASGQLVLEEPRSIGRDDLTKRLMKPDYAVAAMDFPFSVPLAFAKHWQPDAGEMPDLWSAAYELNAPKCFRSIVDQFAPTVADEVLRIGDMHVPGCYSCLHRAQPNMVPMTFEGMKLLHVLRRAGRFHVPPLLSPKTGSPVLLEVMPGAALRAFGLPRINPGKAYKSGANAKSRREEILSELAGKSNVRLPNLDKYRDICLHSHDALDSMVAAVVAAMWAGGSAFHGPTDAKVTDVQMPKSTRMASPQAKGFTQKAAARLEGWIYVPMPTR